MIEKARSWFSDNQTVVYFLVAQSIAIIGAVISMTAYMTQLEARVHTLEIRGSPHLSTIDNRLTVLESQTRENKERLERVVEIMTRELGKTVK